MTQTGREAKTANQESRELRMRQRILDVVASSAGPIDAAELAAAVDLHLTTVRFHLGKLEAEGLVRGEADREGRRGRPRVVYRAAPRTRSDDAQRQLIDVLVSALAATPNGPDRAVAAGRAWADDLATEGVAGEDTTDALVSVLDRLGFDPRLTDAGHINLLACPFRQAAAAHPNVVCSVHRGLIDRTVDTSGDGTMTARLTPFVEPELCTVGLSPASPPRA